MVQLPENDNEVPKDDNEANFFHVLRSIIREPKSWPGALLTIVSVVALYLFAAGGPNF